jgi:hypothetical protein
MPLIQLLEVLAGSCFLASERLGHSPLAVGDGLEHLAHNDQGRSVCLAMSADASSRPEAFLS